MADLNATALKPALIWTSFHNICVTRRNWRPRTPQPSKRTGLSADYLISTHQHRAESLTAVRYTALLQYRRSIKMTYLPYCAFHTLQSIHYRQNMIWTWPNDGKGQLQQLVPSQQIFELWLLQFIYFSATQIWNRLYV